MKREERKAKAIKAIIVADNMAQAADAAGISRRTLYNYLHDPTFVKELEKAYNGMIIEQVCNQEEQKRMAEDVLTELLDDYRPEIRLKAVKIILDNARKKELAMLGVFLRQHETERQGTAEKCT